MARSSRVQTVRSLASALRIAVRPGGPSLLERARSLPRLVTATRTGAYPGSTVGRLALLAAAAAYIVSPFDLVHEAFLGPFGLLDDAFLMSWIVREVVGQTEDFLAWERTGAAPAASDAAGSTVRGSVVR